MAKIHYEGINTTVTSEDLDSSLLDISRANQIPHLHECGGNGRCTTCRIRVIDGIQNLTSPTQVEKMTSGMRNWDSTIRLACQAYPKGDVRVQRLVWTSAEVNKLQLEMLPQDNADERAVAILFCDLRDFTRLASRNLAFDMAYMLNRFYTCLGDPILMNNGIIYQYVGDEIVGIFGTTGGTKEKICTDAVRAAQGMQYAVDRLNRVELNDFETRFEVGIGINFGRAFVGHLGHPKHRQFSVIGDPVNVASRIEKATKETDSDLLISESVRKAIPDGVLELGETFHKELAGVDELTTVHEVLGFAGVDVSLELQSTLDLLMQNEEEFADKFYTRVFEKAPNLRTIFKNNMMMQGRLLTHMLTGIVYALSRPEYLIMGLKALGKSHVKYGVKAEHYPVVKACMLETINEQLGSNYNDRVAEAWDKALDLVTDTMKNWEAA